MELRKNLFIISEKKNQFNCMSNKYLTLCQTNHFLIMKILLQYFHFKKLRLISHPISECADCWLFHFHLMQIYLLKLAQDFLIFLLQLAFLKLRCWLFCQKFIYFSSQCFQIYWDFWFHHLAFQLLKISLFQFKIPKVFLEIPTTFERKFSSFSMK
jgi:hypothetical protein